MAQRIKTDWLLFSTVVAMVFFGLVMVYSASQFMAEMKKLPGTWFLARQAGFAAVAFIALMYFKRKDYRSLSAPTWAFAPLGIVLALLLVVYAADTRAHRWLQIGAFSLQPSEFAKPALAIFLAWFVTRRIHAINTKHTLLPAAMALSVLALCVVVADLGTAAVLLVTAAVVFFVAGLDRRFLLIAMGVCLLAVPVAILSKPYRLARVIKFVDPDGTLLEKIDKQGRLKEMSKRSVSTTDAGYQVKQSLIAVGSGGPVGVGLMQGKQKLLYLPEAHNDFIFAIVGEEMGLFGALAVLAGYLVIILRGGQLFCNVGDDFGRYLALGLSVVIVSQALMNISVVLDLAPTKGFPLPMISYGGSSLLSSLASMGILMSVSEHAG
ncbi:MAG: FtsW/RodA/SpoVE family cell cycle protein [Bryobacteraceae bacterium]|nr:FtsW/RodA/SpoVE family cell cycle protein [Bryobacteraceae bacterium]